MDWVDGGTLAGLGSASWDPLGSEIPHLPLRSHPQAVWLQKPPHHHCPPSLCCLDTHCFYQAVCAPLLVGVFVPEAAGNSQAGWCESPIGDVRLICVPGTAVEGWQAAIDLVQRFRAVHLDQGSVAWGPVPVWRGGWRGGP